MMRLVLFILLCCSVPPRLSAQEVFSFTSESGLSNTCINSIAEDSRKNVWICTRNGLNRYDGAKINIYHHEQGNRKSLGNNVVMCVLDVGPEGVLVGLDTGMQIYSCYTDDFTDVPMIALNGDTLNPHIISMLRTHDGAVYACTAGYGQYKMHYGKGKNPCFKEIHYDYKAPPIRMMEDSRHRLWTLDAEDNVYRTADGCMSLIGKYPEAGSICESSSGKIYLSTMHNGLYRYSEEEGRFLSMGVGDDCIISTISAGADGQLLVPTDGCGMNIFDETTGLLTQSNISTYEYNLTTSNVKSSIVDSCGNLWVGVYWKGVLVLPTMTSGFNYIGRRSVLRNTIGTNCVTALAEDGYGNLWVATDHCGVYHLEHDGTSSVHFKPGHVVGMPSTVMAIHEDVEGTLWLGTSYSGVVKMDKNTGQCTPLSSLVNGDVGQVPNCHDIEEDGYGRLWFATLGKGLFCYNIRTHELVHYEGIVNNAIKYPYRILNNLYIAKLFIHDDKLYLGTFDGLEVIDLLDGKIRHRFCTGMTVTDIAVDKAGMLWVGTGSGLVHLDPDTGEKEIYTSADGLSDNTVKSLEVYPTDGKIWVGTDNGISCFNPATKTFDNYHASDGLQSNEFSGNASLMLNGNLYFGGINGLVYFHPSEVGKKPVEKVDLRVVDFYVNGRVAHCGDLSGSYMIMTDWTPDVNTFNLAYFDNTFSVELAVMNTLYPRVTYSYCLNHGDWMTLDNGMNRITFTGLDPGTYRLRIKAEVYGVVSNVKEICVVIHPVWYLSILAKIIYFLLFLFFCYIAIRQFREHYQAKRILEQHRHVEELNDARMQFFMNISHEIRTPMSLILSPLMKLMKNDKDDERQHSYSVIYQNAQRILRLINQLMDVRKIEKGQFTLRYSKVEIVGFVNNLYELFEGTAHARNIDFTFVHTMERMEVFIDPQNFDKVIMNLLSNAFKFTSDGGRIIIELADMDGSVSVMQDFTLSVTDTGVGVPDKDKHRIFRRFYSGAYSNDYVGTGIGLNLSKLLVELHDGTIDVQDNPAGKGTKFVVRMPKRLDLRDEIESGTDDMPESTLSVRLEKDHLVESVEEVRNGKRSDKHYNVLVVEDDVPIRRYLHGEFASHYYVDEFGNGQEAWDYIVKNTRKVDLVVSDVMMPLMDGTELCRRIKEAQSTNHIPVILLTAKTGDEDRLKGLEIGADAYISKPFNMEILFQTAENLLVSRRMLQGKYSLAVRSEEKLDGLKLQSADEQLMDRIMKVVNENIGNPELSVEDVADKICLSRVHFHRKLKDLTGMTPRDFLKNIRLTQAAKLLSEKHLDITDVSIATGFKSVSTFSTCFKAAYGMPPTEYMKLHADSGKKGVKEP